MVAPLAFIIANLIIYWSGFEVLWKLGIVLVIGYVLIGIFMAFDPQRPPLDWKSAHLAAGVPDRHGHHLLAGPVQRRSPAKTPLPPTNTGNIPFWWDMLVVAGFSLVIYFWAMATRLPRAEMLDLVNRQAGGTDDLPEAPRH